MNYRANNASGTFVNCRTLKSVWKLWYRFTFPRYVSAQCVCVCVYTRRNAESLATVVLNALAYICQLVKRLIFASETLKCIRVCTQRNEVITGSC